MYHKLVPYGADYKGTATQFVGMQKISTVDLYGGSTQGVSGTSSGSVAVAGESSFGERTLLVDRLVPVLVKKDLAYFQIQEIVFQFSILLQQLWHHWVQ